MLARLSIEHQIINPAQCQFAVDMNYHMMIMIGHDGIGGEIDHKDSGINTRSMDGGVHSPCLFVYQMKSKFRGLLIPSELILQHPMVPDPDPTYHNPDILRQPSICSY